MIVRHRSNVRAICNLKESTTGGSTNVLVPFEVTGEGTPVMKPALRKQQAIFFDGMGLWCEKKVYAVLSGLSTVGWVYYRRT